MSANVCSREPRSDGEIAIRPSVAPAVATSSTELTESMMIAICGARRLNSDRGSFRFCYRHLSPAFRGPCPKPRIDAEMSLTRSGQTGVTAVRPGLWWSGAAGNEAGPAGGHKQKRRRGPDARFAQRAHHWYPGCLCMALLVSAGFCAARAAAARDQRIPASNTQRRVISPASGPV